jgi:glycosyltransferase involved in cell wall biosynthesis
MLAAWELGVPLVLTLRGIDHLINPACGYGDCLNSFFEATLKVAIREAARITVCCSDSARRLTELGMQDLSKVENVYHAVGRDRFLGTPEQAANLKESLFAGTRSLIVCVAGMDHVRKGHATLLEAFARLHRERPETFLALVGDGPLRGRFEATAGELSLRNAVRFVGRVHPMDVQHYLRMAALTVLPTLTEAFGNVVFESLYVGTPVVASAVGAPGDVLPQGPYGYTFEPGNADQLLEAMKGTLDDLPGSREMARRGGDLVRREMSIENRIGAFLRIYEEVTVGRDRCLRTA